MRAKRCIAGLLTLVVALGLAGCTQEGTSVSTPSSTSTLDPSPPAVGYPLPDAGGINPLTGEKRPEGLAVNARPVAILVANNEAALPQRGVASADLVYEMLTEGGITRLMAVYPSHSDVPGVGPVRSARDGFVQLAVDYDAILVSIGTSVYAGNLLSAMDYTIINGMTLGTTAFYFDTERHYEKSNEYCWYTSGEAVWAGMERVDINPTAPSRAVFAFDARARHTGSEANYVTVTYSSLMVSGFAYDPASGTYLKYYGDAPHADDDGTQLSFANVFVLECDTSMKVDGVSLDFALTSGFGTYFTGGVAVPIRWEKDSPNGQLRVYERGGAQLQVAPGKSYVGILPTGTEEGLRYSE